MAKVNAQTLLHSLQLNILPVNQAQEDPDAQWLEQGKQIEREMSGDQTHSYKLTIASGQYARVIVEQKGIDVVVRLFAPDGKLITEVDSLNGTHGPESIHVIAEQAGVYRLNIISFGTYAPRGLYEAKIVALRPPTEQDRERVAARSIFDEAERLHEQKTRGSLAAAVKKYEQAFSLYGAIGDRSEQLKMLVGEAITYQDMGELQKALETYNQALQLALELGEKHGQARSLERMARVYFNLGEMEKSLQFAEEALRLFQATDEKINEAQTLGIIGGTYNILGEYEKARERFEQAMRLYQALGDKAAEAETLTAIGYSYHLQDDDPQKSLEYSNKALALYQFIGDKYEEAGERATISAEYARIGERQKALDNATQAISLLQQFPKGSGATVLVNVGVAYYKLGDNQQALRYLNEALQVWQARGDKRSEAITLKHISAALRDLGRLDEARASIEKSIALLEFIRDHAGNPQQQASFVASLFLFYEYYIDLLMRFHAANPQAGNDLAALAFSEKVKARSLVELLAQARVDLPEGADAALLERERDINERLTARMDDLSKLLRGKYTEAQRSAIQNEIEALTSDYDHVQAEIRERNPRYAALTRPQPLSVKEIQGLLDNETVLLEYALGTERSYLWIVTTDKVQSYQLPPKKEIETEARRVYQLLTARQAPARELSLAEQRAREVEADGQYQAEASSLSQTLLGPVSNQLGKKRLLIVADGALQYLPFAALPEPSKQATGEARPQSGKESGSQPLIVEHEIVNLPSASALALMRRELIDRKPAPKIVAVLADPVFEQNDDRVKQSVAKLDAKSAANQKPQTANQTLASSASPTQTLNRALSNVRGESGLAGLRRLLFSRDEAEAILSVTPQALELKALDFQANRKLAMSDALRQYRIIHFSTHGLLDSFHPELSGLVLSLVDETGQPLEGFLRLHEIYNLRLNADLVVLSACQTGLGKEVRGEGLIGLVRGFMYAGAPRVVSSLWEVDDAATAALMKQFYKGILQEKLSPAAALRAAQIEMLKKKHWQSPYYWGAFILEGEWR